MTRWQMPERRSSNARLPSSGCFCAAPAGANRPGRPDPARYARGRVNDYRFDINGHPGASPHEIRCVLVVRPAGQHDVLHRVRTAARAVDDMMKLNPMRRAADATVGRRPLAAPLVALPDLAA